MGIDRKNYVMPVEAAIARELAYRKKLQGLGMETGSSSSSSKDPLHSQVPTATPHLRPTLGLVQNKRPGPPPGPTPPPFPRANSSSSRMWSLADQGSASTPMWRPINLTDQKRKLGATNHDRPAELGHFYCLLCQIDCTTSYNLMMHYQGQKHMSRLSGGGEPKGKNVAGGTALSISKERLYCKLCGIWCKDECTFRFHLQCKNHVLTLQEHEKRMKKAM